MITVTRIGSDEALGDIEPEWSGLVERAADATPFHRPEWLRRWWRHFGSGEMHILAFRSGPRLAGLLASFIHEWEGKRQVTLIGNGITDYLGLIAEPAEAGECARLSFEYLSSISDRWDVCDWQDLRADSPLVRERVEGLTATLLRADSCTRAELPVHADEFDRILPHGLRRTIRIAARRLEREGELRFETIRDPGDGTLLCELFRLHESRWAPRGGPESMMDSPTTQQFLMDATERFSAIGKVRLYTMRYRGELTAIVYGIFDRGRLWGYLTGMDPELSRFSPGSLVLDYAMHEAVREGASAWEFLRGQEPYKFLWGAQVLPKVRLSISHQEGAKPSRHAEAVATALTESSISTGPTLPA